MGRIYIDTEITETGTFTNAAGVLTDPTTITFTYWHSCDRKWLNVTPVKATTGVYNATFTPEYPGLLYFQWKGTGALPVTKEGTLRIERSAFNDKTSMTDYCGCW